VELGGRGPTDDKNSQQNPQAKPNHPETGSEDDVRDKKLSKSPARSSRSHDSDPSDSRILGENY